MQAFRPYITRIIFTFLVFHLTSSLANTLSDARCPENIDELLISHIQIKSTRDYYYCFGFLHGRDRAWQMDFFRRTAQGKNAEVLGYSHIKQDMMMRLLDLPTLAEKLWSEIPASDQSDWIYYAEGVNVGFAFGSKAKEFQIANYQPDQWKPQDSISVLLLQSFDQTRKTFFKKYEEQLGFDKYDQKAIDLFNHDELPWEDTILKDGEYPKKLHVVSNNSIYTTSSFKVYAKLWSDFSTLFGPEAGSNNWVVSKNKSKDNIAILANDPHLNLKTPIFWYWLHLKNTLDNKEVIGGSLPGVPLVISGTNGKVSWGLTNAYINTADIISVKNITPNYLKSLRPVVWFKFGPVKLPFFFKSFERTPEGFPVLPLETKNTNPLILRWSGFWLKGKDMPVLLKLKDTENVNDMNELLKSANIPAWNFVFADTKGDIGYRVVGNPFKEEGKAAFGIPELDFKNFAQFRNPEFLNSEEKPRLLKPKRNYIYTANHRHWPKDAMFHGGQAYSYSFRGLKINEMLKSNSNHDYTSFRNIQCDKEATDARYFVPLMLEKLKLLSPNSAVDKTITLFTHWDFVMSKNCLACGLYRRWLDLLDKKWKTEEPGTYRLIKNISLSSSELQNDFLSSLSEAWNDTSNRKWGELHLNPFKHLSLTENNLDQNLVFSPEISTEGDVNSIDPGSAKWDEKRKIYEHYSGASMRMIIEMHPNKPRIWLSLPGKNKNYDSYTAKEDSIWQNWADCNYSEVAY